MVQVQGTRTLRTVPGIQLTQKDGEPKVRPSDPRTGDRMKNKDKSRKWMWWFLGMVLAMQVYFVRELFALFALFALGFGAIAFVLAALYMLHHGWAVAVGKLAVSEHPAVLYTRQRVNLLEDLARRRAVATAAGVEELAKRAIRRAGSATAR